MYNKTIKCVKVLYYHPEFCYEKLKNINILNKLFEQKKNFEFDFFFTEKINTIFFFILQNCHKLILSNIPKKNTLIKYI